MCRVFRLPPKLAPQSLSETHCRHFGRCTPNVVLVIVRDVGSRKPQRRPAGGIINKARGMGTSAPGATDYPRGSQQRAGTAPGAPHEPIIVAPAHTADKASHRIPDGPDTSFHEPPRRHGFAQHSREHGHAKTCARCQWASRRFQWMYTTPVNPAVKKSWIEVAPPTSDQWGLGCWVCRQAGGRDHVQAAFSNCAVRRPSKARLMKHQRSDRHKRSVQKTILHQRGLAAHDDGASLPAPRWVNSRSC